MSYNLPKSSYEQHQKQQNSVLFPQYNLNNKKNIYSPHKNPLKSAENSDSNNSNNTHILTPSSHKPEQAHYLSPSTHPHCQSINENSYSYTGHQQSLHITPYQIDLTASIAASSQANSSLSKQIQLQPTPTNYLNRVQVGLLPSQGGQSAISLNQITSSLPHPIGNVNTFDNSSHYKQHQQMNESITNTIGISNNQGNAQNSFQNQKGSQYNQVPNFNSKGVDQFLNNGVYYSNGNNGSPFVVPSALNSGQNLPSYQSQTNSNKMSLPDSQQYLQYRGNNQEFGKISQVQGCQIQLVNQPGINQPSVIQNSQQLDNNKNIDLSNTNSYSLKSVSLQSSYKQHEIQFQSPPSNLIQKDSHQTPSSWNQGGEKQNTFSPVKKQYETNNIVNSPSQHQMVQSIVFHYNRETSPSTLKTSLNFGTANNPNSSTTKNIATNSDNISNFVGLYPVTKGGVYPIGNHIKNSRTEISASPEGKMHIRVSSPAVGSTLPISSSTQQSYYKVAQQIRRNEVKERRPSATGGTQGRSSENKGKQAETIGFNQNNLSVSQNNGRAEREGSNSRPQNSELKNIPPSFSGYKDSKKRFTVVEKMNEKFTKKLIIDLCNYVNNSNDAYPNEQGEGNQQAPQVERESRSIWSAKSNMSMLDILSQQRVLQRSLSNSKRTTQQIQQFNSKSRGSRYNDKPWENSSFQNNSKYNSKGNSTTAMRSMNSSQTQTNWNLNGSQNLNQSLSSIKAENIKKGQNKKEDIGFSSVAIGTESEKDLLNNKTPYKSLTKGSNNFILTGFNDSQEIHSSRNLPQINQADSKQRSRGGQAETSQRNSQGKIDHTANPNQKYKFSQNHLSKPSTSSNSFSMSRQSPSLTQNKTSREGTNPNSRYQENKPQPLSPVPTSYQNSKNSTKSEIKKSQIFPAGSTAQKEQSQDNNFSRQDSFEQENNGEGEQEEHYSEEKNQEDQEEQLPQEDYDEQVDIDLNDPKEEQEEEREEGEEGENFNESGSSYSKTDSTPHQSEHVDSPYVFQGFKPPPIHIPYIFDMELEHVPGVNFNVEELRRERQKLIRKISQTFKIKNKALSTSQEYYKMLQVIGKGAFAKVCLAVQLLSGKLVAIKLIDKSILRSDIAKKRVLQEVQILKKLSNHKHVLKLLEVFENRKFIFIVTEYFRGQDLMKIMKERNGEPFREEQVRQMLIQILSGLKYVHGNMVLHRDIKLDNMLVDSNLNLKLIDFGISRVIQINQRMTEQCGTPAFLAPEIIANKGYEGFSSDFWSLGVLLFILFFGKVPFKGNNLVELHRNILNGILPIEEMRDTNVSQEAQDLIIKILKIKVKDRLDLDGIVRHPWMKGEQIPEGTEGKDEFYLSQINALSGFENRQLEDVSISNSIAAKNDKFDEKIINNIEGFGYSREYILRCLNKESLSHVNAIYKVLKSTKK